MPSVGCPANFSSSLNGEDADLDATFAFDLRIAGQDEGCLAEIGLAREALHLFARKVASVGKDAERIARKRPLGEDVHLRIFERALCGCDRRLADGPVMDLTR